MKNRIVVLGIAATLIASISYSAEQKKHPPQVLQIAKEMKALLASKKDAVITIEEKDTDKIVQVAKMTVDGKTRLSLNIAYYPSKDKPEKVLPAAGVNIRDSWKQEMFEPGTFVQYDMPIEDAKYLPYAIHKLFVNFFKSSTDYKIDCYTETMFVSASAILGTDWTQVTTTIAGSTFSYEFQKHNPPIKVELYSDASLRQDSALDALRSLYSQMKQNNWRGFKKLNVDFDKQAKLRTELELAPIPPERYIAGWKTLNFDQRTVLYTVHYKKHTIFVVADGTAKEEPYSTPSFKRIKEEFYATNWDIMEDAFAQTLGDLKFNIVTGEYKESQQPAAQVQSDGAPSD